MKKVTPKEELTPLIPVDFRIGNLLYDRNGKLCRVEQLGRESVEAPVTRGAITGLPNSLIPITEEWLLRFGFENRKGDGFKAPTNTEHWYFSTRSGFIPNAFKNSIESDGYKGVYYIHQLQNLYFTLTGEELKLGV